MRRFIATLLLLVLNGLLPNDSARAQSQTASLQPGVSLERTLERGQSQSFGVSLEKDQFLQLVVFVLSLHAHYYVLFHDFDHS